MSGEFIGPRGKTIQPREVVEHRSQEERDADDWMRREVEKIKRRANWNALRWQMRADAAARLTAQILERWQDR